MPVHKILNWRGLRSPDGKNTAYLGIGIWALLIVLLLGGCARVMMPPPNLYTSGAQKPFGNLREELRSSRVDVLYVTDRAPEIDSSEVLSYGSDRSTSLAYGSAIVEMGNNLSWEELKAYSRGESGVSRNLPLKVISVKALGRLPATPYPFEVQADGTIRFDSKFLAERERVEEKGRKELLRRLSLTRRKDVFLFIHGVGNTLEDAAATAAEGWHFLGREGVPVVYSWPAGRGGLLFYAYDSESSQFTIFHLKQFIRFLASTPEVENVHILAHSRGTDVATTALRELVIEYRAASKDPRKHLKIKNLVLVAADLDVDIVMQRLIAEVIGAAAERVTIYASSDDSALSFASMLFGSRSRLGHFDLETVTEQERKILAQIPNLDFIAYTGRLGGTFGHAYFRENPAISSDIISLLRYGSPPGQATGRPLKHVFDNLWQIDDDYLK